MKKVIRLLLGGSPCTHWSIAQKNNREVEASGLGWELFNNYLIAKSKFNPDYFLYENNVSADKKIKNAIMQAFGAEKCLNLFNYQNDNGVRFTEINSTLLSAQNRERFYVHNMGDIPQPKDLGILLEDILDNNTIAFNEKSYALTASYNGAVLWNTLERKQRTMVAEPICLNSKSGRKENENAQPSLQNRIYSIDGKGTAVTTAFKPKIAIPIRVGDLGSNSQGNRIYSTKGKAVSQTAQGGGIGSNTGLYAVPTDGIKVYPYLEKQMHKIQQKHGSLSKMIQPYNAQNLKDKAPTQSTNSGSNSSADVVIFENADENSKNIYNVKDKKIIVNDKELNIDLLDGDYIIRKLTISEAKRLQTIPEWYQMPCSATQNYKMLGNGWTVEVIKHLLSHIPNLQDYDIEVLSMYDGMSCGQIALKELGCNIIKYKSYEINKYAIQTTQHNFPNTIQCGDAFAVRNEDWEY